MEKKFGINQATTLVQKQGLILSNKMEMSLKVMQLPILDLRSLILQELEHNVALELIKDKYERLNTSLSKKDNLNENINFIENVALERSSLQSTLLSQLQYVKEEKCIIDLASMIIQNLDDKGFNIVRIDELLTVPPHNKYQVRKALNIVRNFEPRGCAFDNINKSLLFQLYLSYQKLKKPLQKKTLRLFRLAIHVLHLAFPFEERGREKHIKEQLEKANILIKAAEVLDVIELIKTLTPYPGYLCERVDESNNYIIPDIYVEYANGEIKIRTNTDILPVIKISQDIKGLSKDNKFAFDSVKNARELISAVKNRNSTLLKVVQIITIFQRNFFCYGISYLSPLRQKDIAEELNISSSTVSRIAANKYLYCNWGLFKIAYFFTQKSVSKQPKNILSPKPSYIASGLSKQACKEMIKNIINDIPDMSDREIGEELKKKGLIISRRTIAKYRNELGIKGLYKR